MRETDELYTHEEYVAVALAKEEVPQVGGEGRDEAKLLWGGEEEDVAAMLWGLVAWVGRVLRGEDRGTAACSVGEMLGGVGLDWVSKIGELK